MSRRALWSTDRAHLPPERGQPRAGVEVGSGTAPAWGEIGFHFPSARAMALSEGHFFQVLVCQGKGQATETPRPPGGVGGGAPHGARPRGSAASAPRVSAGVWAPAAAEAGGNVCSEHVLLGAGGGPTEMVP